jgi:hypothetical protein
MNCILTHFSSHLAHVGAVENLAIGPARPPAPPAPQPAATVTVLVAAAAAAAAADAAFSAAVAVLRIAGPPIVSRDPDAPMSAAVQQTAEDISRWVNQGESDRAVLVRPATAALKAKLVPRPGPATQQAAAGGQGGSSMEERRAGIAQGLGMLTLPWLCQKVSAATAPGGMADAGGGWSDKDQLVRWRV